MPSRSRVWAWLPAVGYMGLIWALSSVPQTVDLGSVPFRDKGIHVVEYGVLAVLLCRALTRTWPAAPRARLLLLALALTCAWGFLDELHQAFVPGRFSDLYDVAADALGGLLGTLVYAAVSRARLRDADQVRG